MPFSTDFNLRDIHALQTTGGPVEPMLFTLDGAAPSPTIAVALGNTLAISDVITTAVGGSADFTLERATDGVTFFGVASWNNLAAGPTEQVRMNTPVEIKGTTPTCLFRVMVTTLGPTAVTCTVRSALQT